MSKTASSSNGRSRQAGFSLAEMLTVLALVGIVIAIGIPLVNEQLKTANARSAADQLGVHLRAARMIAVSQHKSLPVTINIAPTNTYSYDYVVGKTRLIEMPPQVSIMSGSTTTITFKSDGSATAASTITLESAVANAIERWTLTVNTMGNVSITHVRV